MKKSITFISTRGNNSVNIVMNWIYYATWLQLKASHSNRSDFITLWLQEPWSRPRYDPSDPISDGGAGLAESHHSVTPVPWSDTVEPCCDPLHTGTPCHADPGALILHGGVMLGVPGVGDKTLRLSPLALAALEATCVSDSAVLQKHSCPAPDVCYFSRPRYIWKDNAAAPLLCPRPSSQRSPSHILDYNWARRNLPAHRFADAACVFSE